MDKALSGRWDQLMWNYHQEILGPFHPDADGSALADAVGTVMRQHHQPGHTHRPQVHVLDVGCGPGNALPMLAEQSRCAARSLHYTGVDVAPLALADCYERALAHAHSAHVHQRDMTADIPLGPTYDLILSVNSLLPTAQDDPVRAGVLRGLRWMRAHAHADTALVLLALAHDIDRPTLNAHSRRYRLADNALGVLHCLHDRTTLQDELPASGWQISHLHRLHYPAALAAQHGAPTGCFDHLVIARPA